MLTDSSKFGGGSRPTCPSVLIPYKETLYALPLQKMEISVECQVATAFVEIVGTWKNIAKYQSDCLFTLPSSGTVTECSIKVGERVLETIVIPRQSAQEILDTKDKEDSKIDPPSKIEDGKLPHMNFGEYIPNLFRMPIPNVKSTQLITVTVKYIDALQYRDNGYTFKLPLTFHKNLVRKSPINDVLSLNCRINGVSSEVKWKCATHKVKEVEAEKGQTGLVVTDFEELVMSLEEKQKYEEPPMLVKEPTVDSPPVTPIKRELPVSHDFILSYSMLSREIVPSLLVEPAPADVDSAKGNFILFVTPPSIPTAKTYRRQIIILLDRSGSMEGQPYNEATRAVSFTLASLKDTDEFGMIAFDHRQEYFRRKLVRATPANLDAASAWAAAYTPRRGGTDIQTPLVSALKLLESKDSKTLPFIVLVTDGCVEYEREICKEVASHCKRSRILTLGIGNYCNWYFLRMLAEIGRGFSDVVLYTNTIYSQVTELMAIAAVPVLTNISIEFDGSTEKVETYPSPLPDLFMGAPLTISGLYHGKAPESVTLKAEYPDGTPYVAEVKARTSTLIPVKKVFVQQRLALLTARSWLNVENKKLLEDIIELSCMESIATPYTALVAYEKSASDVDGLETKKAPKSQWWRNKKLVAGLIVGNGILIGAAAFSFGNLAATLANVPLTGALGETLAPLLTCCGGCGCCDCSCCSCLTC